MPGSAARVALYYAPCRSDALSKAGVAWLGRDAELGVAMPHPDVAGLAGVTETPRLYGFHATLRPPMRLAAGWEAFIGAAADAATALAPFALPRLVVADLDGFLALREVAPCPDLHRLADRCVQASDPHRLRPDAAELARRRRAGLSAEEEALLLRWGYPHVMQRWRFHMTLTRRLNAAEMAQYRPAAEQHFAQALAAPRHVSNIAVFTQAAEAGPFLIAERLPLGGGSTTA